MGRGLSPIGPKSLRPLTLAHGRRYHGARMNSRGRISSIIEPLLALLACLALIGAPLGGFLSPTRGNAVSEEEHERGHERTEIPGAATAATSARHRLDRQHSLQAEQLVYEFHPASRHVPGVATARPPRPSPCWVRPLRC